MKEVLVAVAIVNWNTADDLAACLSALRTVKVPGVSISIRVVDNASHDESAKTVRDQFPEVMLHALTQNVGFGAGNNLALSDGAFDYALVINPDIVMTSAALATMLDVLRSDEKLCAVAPILVGDDGRSQDYMYRRFPGFGQAALFWGPLRHACKKSTRLAERYLHHRLQASPGSAAQPIDQVPGGCMLWKQAAWRDVGGFDPDYFIWFEDVDLCYRAHQRGWTFAVATGATVLHCAARSFVSWSRDRRVFQFYRAFIRFLYACNVPSRSFAYGVIINDLRATELGLSAAERLGKRPAPSAKQVSELAHEIAEVRRLRECGDPAAFTDNTTPVTPRARA